MKKIYLFAVIFAIAAGFATYFFINGLQHNSVVTGVEEADVVVALRNIEKDTVVTPDMFTTVRLPVTAITYGTLARKTDVYGYVATEKILKGEQVLAAKLKNMSTASDGLEYNGEYRLSYHLEKGQLAYTLPVSEANAVGFFLRAGDYINIYSFDPTAPLPVLEKVEVLEVGVYTDKTLSMQGTPAATYSYITMALTEEQIENLLQFELEQLKIALWSYTEGAELTTLPQKTLTLPDGEKKTVPSEEEPLTNRGMGEVMTEPPTTVSSK